MKARTSRSKANSSSIAFLRHHILYLVQHDEYISAGQTVNQCFYVVVKGLQEKHRYQRTGAVVPRFDSSSRKCLFSLSVFSDIISGPKHSQQRQPLFSSGHTSFKICVSKNTEVSWKEPILATYSIQENVRQNTHSSIPEEHLQECFESGTREGRSALTLWPRNRTFQ